MSNVITFPTSLNARLGGRYMPNSRYVHDVVGVDDNQRGYFKPTPGNTKLAF